jgi:hypothetical protein
MLSIYLKQNSDDDDFLKEEGGVTKEIRPAIYE